MSGVMWAVLAGLGFGLFQSFNRRASRDIDAYRSTFILFAISSIVLVFLSATTQDLTLLRAAPGASYIHFAVAGLIHFLLGWTLLNISQAQIGASRTSALLGASPLFGVAVGTMFLGEWLTLPAIVGILLVVAGVALVTTR